MDGEKMMKKNFLFVMIMVILIFVLDMSMTLSSAHGIAGAGLRLSYIVLYLLFGIVALFLLRQIRNEITSMVMVPRVLRNLNLGAMIIMIAIILVFIMDISTSYMFYDSKVTFMIISGLRYTVQGLGIQFILIVSVISLIHLKRTKDKLIEGDTDG